MKGKKKDLLVGRPYPVSLFQAQKSLPTENSCCDFSTKRMMELKREMEERERERGRILIPAEKKKGLRGPDVCSNAKRR